MTSESEQLLSGGRIPELDRVVCAGGSEGAAVGAEGDGKHRSGMAAHAVSFETGGYVPQVDEMVCAPGIIEIPGGEGAAVGTEGYG
jgi:hypothetical protein